MKRIKIVVLFTIVCGIFLHAENKRRFNVDDYFKTLDISDIWIVSSEGGKPHQITTIADLTCVAVQDIQITKAVCHKRVLFRNKTVSYKRETL